MTPAELGARERHAARQREGHRGAEWEGLPDLVREELVRAEERRMAAAVDNERGVAAPAAGAGCGGVHAPRSPKQPTLP